MSTHTSFCSSSSSSSENVTRCFGGGLGSLPKVLAHSRNSRKPESPGKAASTSSALTMPTAHPNALRLHIALVWSKCTLGCLTYAVYACSIIRAKKVGDENKLLAVQMQLRLNIAAPV